MYLNPTKASKPITAIPDWLVCGLFFSLLVLISGDKDTNFSLIRQTFRQFFFRPCGVMCVSMSKNVLPTKGLLYSLPRRLSRGGMFKVLTILTQNGMNALNEGRAKACFHAMPSVAFFE